MLKLRYAYFRHRPAVFLEFELPERKYYRAIIEEGGTLTLHEDIKPDRIEHTILECIFVNKFESLWRRCQNLYEQCDRHWIENIIIYLYSEQSTSDQIVPPGTLKRPSGKMHKSREERVHDDVRECPTCSPKVDRKKGEKRNDPNEVKPVPAPDLPDWRPWTLKTISTIVLLVVVLLYLALYGALCAMTYANGYITTTNGYYAWAFRYVPAFLAFSVTEMMSCIAADFLSILPYVALTTAPGSRLRNMFDARLTEPTLWSSIKALLTRPFATLAIYSMLVLVPVQMAAFDDSTMVEVKSASTFRNLGLDAIPKISLSSLFPRMAMEAIFQGENTGGLKWVSKMLKEKDKDKISWTDPSWAAIMPFTRPGDTNSLNAATGQNEATYTVDTSALYSYLNCSQIDIITVSASEVEHTSAIRTASDVTLTLEDRDGCILRREWSDMSGALPPQPDNPILHSGVFALWLPATDERSSFDTSRGVYCPIHKQYIVSGPLVDRTAKDVQIDQTTPGWGALSCVPIYYSLQDQVTYDSRPYEQSEQSEQSANIYPGNGTRLRVPEDQALIDAVRVPIENNLLETGFMYSMSSPLWSMSFWGQPLPHTKFDPFLLDIVNFTCKNFRQPLGTAPMSWTNDQACKTFLIAGDLWGFLSAATIAMLTPFADSNVWRDVGGTVKKAVPAWRLSFLDLIWIIVSYIGLFIMIYLNLWRTMGIKLTFSDLFKPSWKSGLCCSPTSIAGVAYHFQRQNVRSLFEGTDALEREKAKKSIRKTIALAVLTLRNSRPDDDEGKGHTRALIQLEKQKHQRTLTSRDDRSHPGLDPLASVDKDSPLLKELRYGNADIMKGFFLVVFVLALILLVLVIKYHNVILSGHMPFQLWPQWPESSDVWYRAALSGIGKFLHRMIFNMITACSLSLTVLWWAWIDQYYRRTQPYLSLATGDTGQETVLLDYMHNYHVIATLQALRNRHFRLSYVTFVNTLIRVAAVGAGGILISTYQPSRFSRPMNYLQTFREDIFLGNHTKAFGMTARNHALARSLSGYPRTSGWLSGNTLFPAVALNSSDLSEQLGLSSELSCVSISTHSTRLDTGSGWEAIIQEGVCSGASWIGACALPGTENTTDNSGQGLERCMTWRYLDETSCPGLAKKDTGRWWLYGQNGTPQTASTVGDQSIAEESTAVSLICTPRFYLDYAKLTFSGDGTRKGGETTIRELQNRTALKYDHWKSDSGQRFSDYASSVMNDTMAGDVRVVTGGTYLDFMSILTYLSIDKSSDSLFNESILARGANISFGSVFAIMAGLGQGGSDGRSTFLLQSTADLGIPPPTTLAKPWQFIATVQKTPLAFGIGVIILVGVSVIFVWPTDKRRTPLNVAYPANVMSMIYDSSIIERVSYGPDASGKFPKLSNLRFRLGLFKGTSVAGRTRIGIDVEKKIEPIEMTPDGRSGGLPFYTGENTEEVPWHDRWYRA
ncbi:hypothetical protein BU24DRAFT_459769 [Aaosphaeria arxii CBS 175.79]|uniref:Uncharacterized protein n=1 Tax=Aaosphaeria arxii CBS 175.79 TaxID=1450172 RepID=A0A6A5Y5N9_9PLEO|nr:uncharacterized protein BU24DRAFT_459769 [Aaosphaeria arxii CBS 175.79]KAF2020161.1 hypothetical protein BU24DRAFT_459769 [Aaosphaeria arxii CBS 175.79]